MQYVTIQKSLFHIKLLIVESVLGNLMCIIIMSFIAHIAKRNACPKFTFDVLGKLYKSQKHYYWFVFTMVHLLLKLKQKLAVLLRYRERRRLMIS